MEGEEVELNEEEAQIMRANPDAKASLVRFGADGKIVKTKQEMKSGIFSIHGKDGLLFELKLGK